MKAYLFIETGEVRKPKYKEWFELQDGLRRDMRENVVDNSWDYPILARHEIEINPKADEVHVVQYKHGMCALEETNRRIFDVPRPKKKSVKKVKRYLWVLKAGKDGRTGEQLYGISNEYRTEEEAQSGGWYEHPLCTALCPIKETEMEVEIEVEG